MKTGATCQAKKRTLYEKIWDQNKAYIMNKKISAEIKEIVLMYHKSRYGKSKDVQESQSNFSAYMAKLYKELKEAK